MAVEMVRIRVSMPRALVEEIDRRVGKKGRSAFIAEAAEQELRRLRRIEALDEFAGSLKDVDILGWETSESAAEWVREQHRAWE
jgi:metal-responsive CopG/Arc/MetJ family transcriptional regulator